MDESRLDNEVRAHRERRGWAQEELARRAGLSRAGISAIETGRLVPSTAAALALARVLDCRVEDLFRLPNRELGGDERGTSWAWPSVRPECRYWRAEVGGRIRRYPVEPTPLGLLAHDGRFQGGVFSEDARHAADQTLVLACCDPAAGLLAQELAATSGVRLLVLQRSSQAALELLDQGLVHAAGVHLARADDPGASRAVVRDRLETAVGPRTGVRLLHVAGWDEGLALTPGLELGTVRSVLDARLRWVRREPGSAARQCMDELLGEAAEKRPRGRPGLAFDHRGVAETIRGGWADAGVCLRLTGVEAGLDFLSIRRESYDVCFADSTADDPRLRALVRVIRSSAYRRLLGELPGYDTSHTGELERVDRSARAPAQDSTGGLS